MRISDWSSDVCSSDLIDAAVAGAIQSKYRNTGQTCVCANRLFVQNGVYDAFVERLAIAVRGLQVAGGMEDGAQIGPPIDLAGVETVEEHVRSEARSVGKGWGSTGKYRWFP